MVSAPSRCSSSGHVTRQAITWSKGLHQLLAVTERTDEEIAAEEIGGEDLAVIHSDDWRRIVQIPGLPSLILDRAERGGLVAVNELLAPCPSRRRLPAVSSYWWFPCLERP
jgi:hypothetical protein